MLIQIEIDITRDDYLEACTVRSATDKAGVVRNRRWTHGAVALMSVGFFLLFMGARTIAAIGVAGGLLIIVWRMRGRSFDLEKAWQMYQRGAEPATCLISEDGLQSITSRIETKYRWGAFSRMEQSKNLIFLYFPCGQMRIIPKRAFNDAEELRLVIDLLDDRLNQKLKAFPVVLTRPATLASDRSPPADGHGG